MECVVVNGPSSWAPRWQPGLLEDARAGPWSSHYSGFSSDSGSDSSDAPCSPDGGECAADRGRLGRESLGRVAAR